MVTFPQKKGFVHLLLELKSPMTKAAIQKWSSCCKSALLAKVSI